MKKPWLAFRMCLSMFTVLPIHIKDWDAGLQKKQLLFLPAAGLCVGIPWCALGFAALSRPAPMLFALCAALPFLITGFIHLDGLMDVADAVLSWRPKEEKLRILKDPTVGAFAAITLGLVLLFQYAAMRGVRAPLALLCVPVLSRSCAAIAVLRLPTLSHSEYAKGEEPLSIGPLIISGVLALILLFVFAGIRGALSGFALIGAAAYSARAAFLSLGGFSGDVAGFMLTLSELAALIVLGV